MSIEANKTLVLRYFDAWNASDLDGLDAIIADDVVDHSAYEGQQLGRDGYREFFRLWHAAFPGLRSVIQDMIAEADRIAIRWSFHGRHDGPYLGIPATGRDVSFEAISIVRIVNGLIAEEWFVGDQLGLLRQLGAVPPA